MTLEENARIHEIFAYDKGVEHGRDEEKLEIARKLRVLGLSEEQINEATGLTIEEIQDLD
jgi:predicted transposase/invertase (TIGR01784 family)